MTQVSPYTALSDQASLAISEIGSSYGVGIIRDLDDAAAAIRGLLTDAAQDAGSTMTKYEPISKGEPPDLDKMNRFAASARRDIMVMQRQMEALQAATVNLYNMAGVELSQAESQNGLVGSRYRTLELYSSDVDPTVITFMENFASDDMLDPNAVGGVMANILANSYLTLNRYAVHNVALKGSSISIEPESSGFPGNYQEAIETGGDEEVDLRVQFLAEDPEPTDDSRALTDDSPLTWFEYSAFRVKESDKELAQDFGFKYFHPEFNREIRWSDGPVTPGEESQDDVYSEKLKLVLTVNLREVTAANSVTIEPQAIRGDYNRPFYVKRIETTEDGDNWAKVDVDPFWVSTDLAGETLRTTPNFFIDNATIVFPSRRILRVRFTIEQPYVTPALLGHVYYEDTKTEARVAGTAPTILKVRDYYTRPRSPGRNVTRNREVFSGEKWSIGLRNIEVVQSKYELTSTMISRPILAPKDIDRVSLDADVYIPPEFEDGDWVQFFISGDGGATWTEISRATDVYRELPEVIIFNDTLPEGFRETGATYVDTDGPVESILVKTVLSRPGSMDWGTPMVRSYTLRMKTR